MNIIILVILIVALVYLFSICHIYPFGMPMGECEDDCETCEFRDSEDCLKDMAEKYLFEEDDMNKHLKMKRS